MIVKMLFGKKKKRPEKAGHLDRKSLGKMGEDIACRYLRRNNYAILERNYRCRMGEVDIIAQKGDKVVFVEVKSQYEHVNIPILKKVGPHKQKKLAALANYYRRIRLPEDTPCRIDVITVIIDAGNHVRSIDHYENAV